jgi:glycosyltransferase involved in cell wall biosynthesis
VRCETGAEAAVVGASLDGDLFRPVRPEPPPQPFRVAAMIRPSSPRRGPDRTMRAFAALKARMGEAVELFTFGVEAEDPAYRRLASFPHRHLGVLEETRLAALFGRIHVFADFSDYQAMGLTALEAMACGATAIVPAAGGTSSFARDGENALVVDTTSEAACTAALERLASDVPLRARLMREALRVLVEHPPERSALKTLEALLH